MTVKITATTRPTWSQLVATNTVNDQIVGHRMLAIAERELVRTTATWFEVTARSNAGERMRLICDREPVFYLVADEMDQETRT